MTEDLLTLPNDLSPEEARLACHLEDVAVAEAQRRAALAIRVRREIVRLAAQGTAITTAFELVDEDERFPVSAGTARDIWYRRGAWSAD